MTSKIVTIASGKGGTGKTTVAVNLAYSSDRFSALLDCDVEEPNVHLFIDAVWDSKIDATEPFPSFDLSKCDLCGICRNVCRFNAIAITTMGPMLFDELCHACGGCTLACPNEAISEIEHPKGVVRTGCWNGIFVAEGRMNIGQANSPPVIEAVKKYRSAEGITLIDAPPGASCPAIAAMKHSDYLVLVTEPTPFGLHDLKLTVEAARLLKLKIGVIVNRAGVGNRDVYSWCDSENIPILANIPSDRKIAEAYSSGGLITRQLPQYQELFTEIAERVLKEVE